LEGKTHFNILNSLFNSLFLIVFNIKPQGELKDKQDIDRVDSFFDWYQDADFPDEIGQIIIEDLFKYPSQVTGKT